MATEIEYALMAGRIYQSTRDKNNWLPDLLSQGWIEQRHEVNDTSGFEVVSFKKGTEIVISFAGTGSAVDWFWANIGGFFGIITDQLRQAADYYLTVKASNQGSTISFTGHSLGGGLASLMAVFFGETAVTFDQAPFRNSATLFVATTLKDYLLNQRGYSESDLQGLTNFISTSETYLQERLNFNNFVSSNIPNETNVVDFSVQGEILSAASGLRIGTSTSLIHGAPDLMLTFNLHSQALLTAFMQSDATAPAQHSFRDVTFKLPDVVRMSFSGDLYNFPTGGRTESFIERLVRHQNGITGLTFGEASIHADAMLTRFTSDLWKLAQDGGLTMTDNLSGGIFSNPPNNVSKALIAFAMQMYYENAANATNPNKELFTQLAGGLYFDRTDVAVSLGLAKGYTLYFRDYVSTAFSPNERQLILTVLPQLQDWYIQAGVSDMTVVDNYSRGTFMLGGGGADTLTGSNQTDLLVGNTGSDTLDGGTEADRMLGGLGDDTYYVDQIRDLVSEDVNHGIDTIYASVDYTLIVNVEHLTLQDTAVLGAGNKLGNIIIGNEQDNLLNGYAGDDTLQGSADDTDQSDDILNGGPGDDILIGGWGYDYYYIYSNESGIDTILDDDGKVWLNDSPLTGGQKPSAGALFYESEIAHYTLTLDTLTVLSLDDQRTYAIIPHFTNGLLGIFLKDEQEQEEPNPTEQDPTYGPALPPDPHPGPEPVTPRPSPPSMPRPYPVTPDPLQPDQTPKPPTPPIVIPLTPPTYRDPIILDLNGDGVQTKPLDYTVWFDHQNSGFLSATGWVRADDALLVMDRNGNGLIDNGSELFGDSTPLLDGTLATNGYQALAA